ncbi:MAG: LysM peptidoglycan-binding domain-containing protein [Anaerolineae bacterium]
MQSRPRALHVALLIAAVAAPVMYLLALARYGSTLLYLDVPRLVVTYIALGIGAAAATYLLLSNGRYLFRVAAGLALIATLGSIVYAEVLWRPDMERAIAEVERRLFADNQTGILVAAASDTPEALEEARAIQEGAQRIFEQSSLGDLIAVRPSQTILTEDQARTIGKELGANVVVWTSSSKTGTRITDDIHITVLGASNRGMSLDPISLLVAGITQETLTVSRTRYEDGKTSTNVVDRFVVPVVTAFGFLAENQPLLAGTQFQVAADYPGLSDSARYQLRNYMGATLLVHGRADLATTSFIASNAIKPNARAWMGLGAVAVTGHQWDQAREAFSQAVALDPYAPGAYCGLGYVQATRRDIHNAYLAYQQAIALDPGYGVPYAFMGLLYELRADVPAAQQAYQQAAALVRFDRGMYNAINRRSEEIRQNPPTPVPTATPRPVPTASPIPTSAIHTVKQGDSLKAIADMYGVSISEIVEINTLEDPDALYIGQFLLIPPKPEN